MLIVHKPEDLQSAATKLLKHLTEAGNKPKIVVVGKNRYSVESLSEKGKMYDVFLFINRYDEKGASCECWPNIRQKVCTHVLIAIKLEARMYSKFPTYCIFDKEYL